LQIRKISIIFAAMKYDAIMSVTANDGYFVECAYNGLMNRNSSGGMLYIWGRYVKNQMK